MVSNALFQALLLVGAAVLTGWILVQQGAKPIFLMFGAAAISFLTLQVSEFVLPILLSLTLAMGSSYRIDLSTKSFYLRFFLLALMALRGVFLFLAEKKRAVTGERPGMTPVHIGFLAVAAYGMFSAAYSVDPGTTFQRAFTYFLLYFVIFVYFWIRARGPEECESYARSLWLSFAILIGIGFAFLGTGVPRMTLAGRLRLVLGNPNQLGHYCAFMAPLVLWMFFSAKTPRERLKRGWVLAALALALVWSGSRGALLATFLSCSVQALLCYRKVLIWLVLAGGLALSASLLLGDRAPIPGADDPSFLQETVLRQEHLATGSGRTGIWKAAWRLSKKRPLMGYGFGCVDKLFEKGYFPELGEFQGGHIHNSYLEEILNIGWLGAIPLFLSLLYLLLAGARSVQTVSAVHPHRPLLCALFCVAIAGAVSGVFESWFTSVGSVFCFPYWFSGMLLLRMKKLCAES